MRPRTPTVFAAASLALAAAAPWACAPASPPPPAGTAPVASARSPADAGPAVAGTVEVAARPDGSAVATLRRQTVTTAVLARAAATPGLSCLQIVDCDFDRGLDWSPLAAPPALTRLTVRGGTLAGGGTLRAAARLEALELVGCRGVDAVAGDVATMAGLHFLNLSSSDVSPAGLRRAGGAPLRVLAVSGTGVGDESVEPLARMPALETLFCVDCPISDAGFERLLALTADRRKRLDVQR
ncbi:MAG TPA: hypothetical protein VF796_09880 [Humisphaera sp.]